MKSLHYVRSGDYFLPVLELPPQPATPIGHYGRMRKTYLQQHRPILFSNLVLSGKLYPHLSEIDNAANDRLENLITALANDAGATEQLKAENPMRWVGLMNACKAQAEEIILHELIFA